MQSTIIILDLTKELRFILNLFAKFTNKQSIKKRNILCARHFNIYDYKQVNYLIYNI